MVIGRVGLSLKEPVLIGTHVGRAGLTLPAVPQAKTEIGPSSMGTFGHHPPGKGTVRRKLFPPADADRRPASAKVLTYGCEPFAGCRSAALIHRCLPSAPRPSEPFQRWPALFNPPIQRACGRPRSYLHRYRRINLATVRCTVLARIELHI
jgi:hypothetical protein